MTTHSNGSSAFDSYSAAATDDSVAEEEIYIRDETTGQTMELAEFVRKYGARQAAFMLTGAEDPDLVMVLSTYLEASDLVRGIESRLEDTEKMLKESMQNLSDREFQQLLEWQESEQEKQSLARMRDDILMESKPDSPLLH